MKNFFLVAGAITAFLCSCDTPNEYTNDLSATNLLKEKVENKVNYYELYHTIMNDFVYDNNKSYNDNILLFEKYVNSQIITDKYQKIDSNQLYFLSNVKEDYIRELSFSEKFKNSLQNLIITGSTSLDTIDDEFETSLIQNLYALHFKDNGFDNRTRNRRTIAFAYGAQYDVKQAILYAGTIELIQ